MVTTEAIRRANSAYVNMNTQLFTGQTPFLSPNQQCQSTVWKNYCIPRICSTQTHLWIFKHCL